MCFSNPCVIYDIVMALDKKQTNCAAVFVDLSKAFDSANHQLLSEKLLDIGISDKVVDWFRNRVFVVRWL